MKFKTTVIVRGMKASKGEYEGHAYDSTKAYIETELDKSKGMTLGAVTSEYKLGDSTEIDKFRNIQFPFEAEADAEMVSSGSVSTLVIHGLRPLKSLAPQPPKVG